MTSWFKIFVLLFLSLALCFVLSHFLFVQILIAPEPLEMVPASPLCLGDQNMLHHPKSTGILIRAFIKVLCMELSTSF